MTKLTQADACLIGGLADRLLRLYRDRISDPEDIETLEDLQRAPYAAIAASHGGKIDLVMHDLRQLEEKLGLPALDLDPHMIDAHAYAKLAEAYEQHVAEVREDLAQYGLERTDPYYDDEHVGLRMGDLDKYDAGDRNLRAAFDDEQAEQDA